MRQETANDYGKTLLEKLDTTFDNSNSQTLKSTYFNGNIRMREKIVRGIKKDDSAILKGMQLHHNYIRPHQGLDGDTPADRAGIRVMGDNKWKTIIQNAVKSGELAPNTSQREEAPINFPVQSIIKIYNL